MSKTDNIGCFLEQIGKAVQELDDNFGDENGNINIDQLDEILKLAGFSYQRFKVAYETCTGKQFNISLGESASAGILEAILKFVLGALPKVTTPTVKVETE